MVRPETYSAAEVRLLLKALNLVSEGFGVLKSTAFSSVTLKGTVSEQSGTWEEWEVL